MTDDITHGKGSGRPPGCSCHPDDRPPICQKEHATTHCKLAYAEAELTEARERIQAILDWADFALNNPEVFKIGGVRNLTGPAFDKARAFLTKGEKNDG